MMDVHKISGTIAITVGTSVLFDIHDVNKIDIMQIFLKQFRPLPLVVKHHPLIAHNN